MSVLPFAGNERDVKEVQETIQLMTESINYSFGRLARCLPLITYYSFALMGATNAILRSNLMFGSFFIKNISSIQHLELLASIPFESTQFNESINLQSVTTVPHWIERVPIKLKRIAFFRSLHLASRVNRPSDFKEDRCSGDIWHKALAIPSLTLLFFIKKSYCNTISPLYCAPK